MNEEIIKDHEAFRNARAYKGFELMEKKKSMRLVAFALVENLLTWRKEHTGRFEIVPWGYFDPRSLLRDDQMTEEYKQYRINEDKRTLAHEILEITDEQSKEHLRAAMFQCQNWYDDLEVRHSYQGPGPFQDNY